MSPTGTSVGALAARGDDVDVDDAVGADEGVLMAVDVDDVDVVTSVGATGVGEPHAVISATAAASARFFVESVSVTKS